MLRIYIWFRKWMLLTFLPYADLPKLRLIRDGCLYPFVAFSPGALIAGTWAAMQYMGQE